MKKELLVETDILADHLINKSGGPSILEQAMQGYVCFTTVLNSSELMFAAINEEESRHVQNLLRSLKILGLNSRYSLYVKDYSAKVESSRYAIISVVSSLNKLPVLTGIPENYKNTGLEIITPEKLRGIS